jgi:hypothetical protein
MSRARHIEVRVPGRGIEFSDEQTERIRARVRKNPRRQDLIDAIVVFCAEYHGGGGSKLYGHGSRLNRFARPEARYDGLLTRRGRRFHDELIAKYEDDWRRNVTRHANF